ncbi:Dot/Icm T4SS effector VpdC [Legionella worsleiensis]|uniref:Esterase of the alpha-beta hydrolase superfamily protein n=1 Tax=Legionella worsleiensis TaxID=45076 RepID=A0A0W1A6G5_9GAMM|nr:Dot/Icm T4SS effector VpdC [Legionella worsleiensis]KTD76933.1 esterase of the alpha-beta hydrolase superfamily protein [Legionella worsleiensis]STY33396.1 esterase of the alpha-beta hydrolase superfamily [Legionella worsleiensis]
MTPQHIISQLLKSDIKYPKNLDLLKKIILTAYLGRLRINGLAPDKKIVLGNYLFDNERIIFDFSRLSEENKERFHQWLLIPHQAKKEQINFSSVNVNEYRGYTAEERSSWRNTLSNWFNNNQSDYWKINDFEFSLNYQLTGIEITHGEKGILIGFNQFLVPLTGEKYKDPNDLQEEPLGNTKRVIITNQIVEQLVQEQFINIRPEKICKQPHPQAIDVLEPQMRFEDMSSYRKTHNLNAHEAWYMRLWKWVKLLFTKERTVRTQKCVPDNNLSLLYETNTIKIFQRSATKEIIVREKKPDIENLVFCGGGAKIFAHIGVWKALNRANIIPKRFAGSSAGAIMAMLCYLGYKADEIADLFSHLKHEHIVRYDIDFEGLSDSDSLKAVLDFALVNKLKEIVAKYNIPYPQGVITFRTLDNLRKQYPDCGLGEEITVTATNKKQGKTTYFSLARTPDMEFTKSIEVSAKLPVVYKAELIDGEAHSDGGVLNNFPTDVFSDDHSTLLESEYGNNLKLLAVQFDNGTERVAIDRIKQKVYRENVVLNRVYSFLSGVSDPASGWVKDRLKLRQYAHQAIVPNVDDIPISGFSVTPENQLKMIQRGYEATQNYLKIRYGVKPGSKVNNQELMYSSFSSLADLLSYCCYRGDKKWFDCVNNLISESTLPNRTRLMRQSLELRALYFGSGTLQGKPVADNRSANGEMSLRIDNADHAETGSPTFFGNAVSKNTFIEARIGHHDIFHALFPVFVNLSSKMVLSKADKVILDKAQHSLAIHNPLACLEHFEKIKGKTHIILHLIINLIKDLQDDPQQGVIQVLQEISTIPYYPEALMKTEYYEQWDLSFPQTLRVFKLLKNKQYNEVGLLLDDLKNKAEPLQTIKNGVFHNDFSDGSIEEKEGPNLGL